MLKQKALKSLVTIGALALFFVSFAAIPRVFVWAADSISSLPAEKNNLEDQLDDIKAKIKAYKQIINLKERQGTTLADQIKTLEAQAEALQAQIDANSRTLSTLEDEIKTLNVRITEKEALIQNQKKILSELMRSSYADYSSNAPLFFLASSDSFSYLHQADRVYQTSDKVREILESVQNLRQGLITEQDEVENKKAVADNLRAQLSERETYLEITKGNKEKLLGKTQAEVAKYDDLVDDLEEQREAIEDEIEELEAGKVGELNLKDMPSFKKGTLSYPVKSVRVTQGYGKTKFAKRAYASGMHNGIDYGGSIGTAILAAADGKVISTGDLGRYAYGRWIAIDHGNGLVTMYGHLSSIGVSRGEKVDRGDTIGKMGSTGFSTGSHVHFTVFSAKSYEVVNSKSVKGLKIPVGATVNPSVYLP